MIRAGILPGSGPLARNEAGIKCFFPEKIQSSSNTRDIWSTTGPCTWKVTSWIGSLGFVLTRFPSATFIPPKTASCPSTIKILRWLRKLTNGKSIGFLEGKKTENSTPGNRLRAAAIVGLE